MRRLRVRKSAEIKATKSEGIQWQPSEVVFPSYKVIDSSASGVLKPELVPIDVTVEASSLPVVSAVPSEQHDAQMPHYASPGITTIARSAYVSRVVAAGTGVLLLCSYLMFDRPTPVFGDKPDEVVELRKSLGEETKKRREAEASVNDLTGKLQVAAEGIVERSDKLSEVERQGQLLVKFAYYIGAAQSVDDLVKGIPAAATGYGPGMAAKQQSPVMKLFASAYDLASSRGLELLAKEASGATSANSRKVKEAGATLIAALGSFADKYRAGYDAAEAVLEKKVSSTASAAIALPADDLKAVAALVSQGQYGSASERLTGFLNQPVNQVFRDMIAWDNSAAKNLDAYEQNVRGLGWANYIAFIRSLKTIDKTGFGLREPRYQFAAHWRAYMNGLDAAFSGVDSDASLVAKKSNLELAGLCQLVLRANETDAKGKGE